MPRCEYDTIFQRVFCMTLVAIAFTFTVILTNVFIDIDGLLSRRDKVTDKRYSNKEPGIQKGKYLDISLNDLTDDPSDKIQKINDDKTGDAYRSKRSVESQNFLFHINNPGMKSILTSRLAMLLDELDNQDSSQQPKEENVVKSIKQSNEIDDMEIIKRTNDMRKNTIKSKNLPKVLESGLGIPTDEILHLTMHDILLQGIVSHMDFNDVYKKIHLAMNNLKGCNTKKAPNVLIKARIDITAKKNKKFDDKNSKENIKGVVQVIYNGKSIKFTGINNDNKNTISAKNPTKSISTMTAKKDITINKLSNVNKSSTNDNNKHLKSEYLTNLIAEFIQNHPTMLNKINTEKDTDLKGKRLKRQLKIHYEEGHADNKNKFKTNSISKSDDDELYVEIDTHFDSKGLKGGKKKKLIRNLIEKIQNAIHSDIDLIRADNKTKHKKFHVKKRTQHPLALNRTMLNKFTTPVANINDRHSGKLVKKGQPVPFISSKSGDSWKKTYLGPGFLTASKSLNSAELGEVNIDYDKVIAFNGIPQRLQQPLNTNINAESEESNTYYNSGNLKFYIRNLPGTGLAIGFNQYIDEPPDTETLQIFDGVENIVKNINKNNDDTHDFTNDNNSESKEELHTLFKRDVRKNEKHGMTRSEKNLNNDYLTQEYNVLFGNDKNYEPPFDNIEEITEDETKKITLTLRKDVNDANAVKTKLTENSINSNLSNIFNKNLKLSSSEILKFASLLNRKKRDVKKITNSKNIKLRQKKYININKKATKILIMKKKRNKREINKIRILGTGALSKARKSTEDVYFVSNENMLADRAIIREVETLDEPIEDKSLRRNNIEDSYQNIIPFIYEDSVYQQYANKLRHSPLMSKYPHIFMEEISHPNEKYEPFTNNNIEFKPLNYKHKSRIETTEAPLNEVTEPQIEDIVSFVTRPPKQSYRLTVKITPKNITSLNSGFKEIHTSINKSFSSNGLVYSSLVNVSEISKIENRHKNTTTVISPFTSTTKSFFQKQLEDQRLKMDALLRQHKRLLNEQFENFTREKMNVKRNSLLNLRPIAVGPIEEVSTNVPQNPQIDISNILASVLHHLQVQSHKTTTETTQTSTSTTQASMKWKELMDKTTIIKSMEKHENLTNKILEQLNKNTETLQTFLSKLTRSGQETKNDNNQTDTELFTPNIPHHTWKPFSISYIQKPMQETTKNDTKQIPFEYLQQHYPVNFNSKSVPIASIVYHGLVNNVRSKNHHANSEDNVVNVDRDRYFIDGIANGYKIVTTKKNVDITKTFEIKTNNATLH
ncbi:hypothetical protein ACJJTC_019055 [Scirpophaga incertulas]